MKLKFISNACCIYEAEQYKILADPWLAETCFYGGWRHDPPITTKPEDVLDVDALYISHIHPDHLCEWTLSTFRRDVPILCLSDAYSICHRHLERLGFTNIITLKDLETTTLGPFRITMYGPFTKHFHAKCEIGNIVDSSIMLEHNGIKILNCNDNAPTVEFALKHRETHGKLKLAQLPYNAAGPYPACFNNLSYEEKLSESRKVIDRHLKHLIEVVKAFDCEFVQPFAGSFKFTGELEHLNEYAGTCSVEYAADQLIASGIKPLILKENEVHALGS